MPSSSVEGGSDIAIGSFGVVRPDGMSVFKDAEFWSGLWSPDDSLTLVFDAEGRPELLQASSGKRSRLKLPAGMKHPTPLGFSAGGATLYLGARVFR